MIITKRCKLLAIQEGLYTIYVFENMDEELTSKFKYLSCTKLPNWIYNDRLEIGDEGFLHCEYVTAGDTYFKANSLKYEQYKYTNCYFVNFIKMKDKIEIKDIKF